MLGTAVDGLLVLGAAVTGVRIEGLVVVGTRVLGTAVDGLVVVGLALVGRHSRVQPSNFKSHKVAAFESIPHAYPT